MRTLIITWCEENGEQIVEEIQDISILPEQLENLSFEKLQGVPYPEQTQPLRDRSQFYGLRARYNTHRKYRRYGISVPNNVTDDMIFNNFDRFVVLIKSKGIKLPLR